MESKQVLKCGDSRELLKTMKDECVDLIVSDVPYKTTSRGNAGNSGGMLQKDINKKGQVFNHNDIDISQYADELYRVLKQGSHCYLMCNHINLQPMLKNLSTWTMCKDCGHIDYNVIKSTCGGGVNQKM